MVVPIIAGVAAGAVLGGLFGGKKAEEPTPFERAMAIIEGDIVSEAMNDPTISAFEETATQKAVSEAQEAASKIGDGLDPP